MKTIKNYGLALGIGLLGASTLAASVSAQAAPRDEVQAARRQVKGAKRDLSRAVTPKQRRIAEQELRDANLHLSAAQRGLAPKYGVGHGLPQIGNFRSYEGTVTNDLKGNDFIIRTRSGETVRVLMPSGEPGSLGRGDLVRVTGNYSGATFIARNTDILRNR